MKFNYPKFIYYFLWILILAAVQGTIAPGISAFGVTPNLFVVFIICVAMLSRNPFEPAVAGFILGFVFDFMVGHRVGVGMLIMMYIGVFSGLLFEKILTGKYFGILPVAFAASFLFAFLYYVMNFAFWGQGNFGYAVLRVMLPESVYNTLLCVPFYWLAKKFYRRTDYV